MGISVGNAGHVKTPAELDAQADILKKIMAICARYSVAPNLHNHTYEVENNLYDLKGTLSRIPDIKLGARSQLAHPCRRRSSSVHQSIW